MGKKCDRNCFECPHEDCVINTASLEERREIRERDNRYFNAIEANGVIKQRPTRAKHRGRRT